MNGLKRAEEQSSFSGKIAGCQGNYIRQRMQQLPNRGSEGLSSGLRNKTQCLNTHEKNLLGAGERTQLVRCHTTSTEFGSPSTSTEVEGVVKLSVISPGETETGGSLGLTGQSGQPDSVRDFCLKTKGGEKTEKNTEHQFLASTSTDIQCIA